MEDHWEPVDEVSGSALAEMLRGLLEAQGMPVLLSQEGAGRAMGLTVGTLGMVQILVPAQYVGTAREVLEQYYAGEFDDQEPPADARSEAG